MIYLEEALKLARLGYHVFPLWPNTKIPVIEGFPEKATTDEEQIRKWWADGVDYNIGISTTSFGDGIPLLVIDVDNKGEKKGDEEVIDLELQGFEFPDTAEQITPTKGRHLIFKAPYPMKQGVKILGTSGIDTRAKGGYIVGGGSTIDGIPYVYNHDTIADAPKWLIDKLGKYEKKESLPAPKNIDPGKAAERAIFYLENEAPEAIEGSGGDNTTYRVACRVKDYGVSADTCAELMVRHWYEGCGWTYEELKRKVDHAYKYGNQAPGAASPEAQFKPIVESKKKSYLEEINDEFALIFGKGPHVFLREMTDENGQAEIGFWRGADFKEYYSNKLVQTSGKGRSVTYAEAWLQWEDRREYNGIVFAPEREARNRYYNLWKGFTCNPLPPEEANKDQKRGLELLLDHAKRNICGGDEVLFNWLMGYFAHLVQKPYVRPKTTLVFKGSKGTGKNSFVDRIGHLIGRHYLVTGTSRYLTSNFNSHMDGCLMLVLDEAFWSGDKTAEGVLKTVTTNTTLMIERKGMDPYRIDNLVRLVILGNDDWVVPASADERRYAVFEMGEGNKKDRKFFSEMENLLDTKGGCGLLLHYLKHFDLDSMDVNDAPNTKALLEQKLQTISPLEQWWHESLEQGHISYGEFSGQDWPERLSKETLYLAFSNYLKARNITKSYQANKYEFGKKLKKIVPSLSTDLKVKQEDGSRINAYKLPTLEVARKEWEQRLGQEIKWP